MPYDQSGHTNFASAPAPTVCPLVIAGQTNSTTEKALAIPISGRDHPRMNIGTLQIGEDGVNWPVGLSGRPHLCGN